MAIQKDKPFEKVSKLEKKMTSKKVSKKKLKDVEDMINLIKEKKTILVASIKNIPSAKFQEIGKKLRGKAIIKVPKKNLIFRAIDESSNESVKALKEKITESVAILFSDLDAFDLAGELVRNKSPAKAKPGQEAPEDIEVQEGPTDLVPGPAISELGALGIQIQIEKGKIHIKDSKVIVKKGEKISQGAADVMNKLDIKPFSIGFEPLCAFDTKEGKLYLEIKVDREGTLKEIKECFNKALALAVEIEYINDNTISLLISKAAMHEKALNNLMGEEKNAANAEDDKQVSEKSEEEKISDTATNENSRE